MGLEADFNAKDYKTAKINDYVLGVSYPYNAGSDYNTYHSYDFVARILTTRTGASEGGATVTPFSQLDPDSLEAMRQRLLALGGHPPELESSGSSPQPRPGPTFRP